MKSKSLKGFLTGLLLTLAACCFALSFTVGVKSVKADVSGITVYDTVDLRTLEPMGLRFTVEFDKTVKATVDEGGFIGVIIVPESYVNDFNDYKAANENYEGGYFEYFKDIKGKMLDTTFNKNEIFEQDGHYFVKLSITNVKFNNLNRKFVAIAYVAENGAEPSAYEYAEVPTAHDIGTVVTTALNESSEEDIIADYGEDVLAFFKKTQSDAEYNKKGVTYDEETGKYAVNGVEITDPADSVKSYTVKHVKVEDGKETVVSEEVVESVLGKTVEIDYNSYEEFLPVEDSSTMKGTISADEDLTLKAVYARAIKISGAKEDTYFYTYSSGKFGNKDLEVTKGTFAGSENAYRLKTINDNYYYALRVLGINSSYLKDNNINKLKFKLYYPYDSAVNVSTTYYNLMTNVYNTESATASTVHVQAASDSKSQYKYFRMYDEQGIRWMSIGSNQWFTVELNLSEIYQKEYSVPRTDIELISNNNSESLIKEIYIKDMEFLNEDINKFSAIPVSVDDSNIVASVTPRQGTNIGIQGQDYVISKLSEVSGVKDVYSVIHKSGGASGSTPSNPLGLVGISAAQISELGIKKLTFKIRWPATNADGTANSDPTATIFTRLESAANSATTLGATLSYSDLNSANGRTNLRVYGQNGTRHIANLAADTWYDVELNTALIGDLAGGTESVLNFLIRLALNRTCYFADFRLSADNFYRNSIPVTDSEGNETPAYIALKEDGAINVKTVNVTGQDGVPTYGDKDVYSLTATVANNHKSYLLGVNKAWITSKGYNRFVIKFWVPEDYALENFYFYVNSAWRMNAGNVTQNGTQFRLYNDDRSVQYYGDAVSGLKGQWVTMVMRTAGMNDIGTSDEVGVTFWMYTAAGSQTANVNKPMYITDAHFETAATDSFS